MIWPFVIVFFFATSVVDMALVLGPTQPPTFSMVVWSDLNAASRADNARGGAGAVLLALASGIKTYKMHHGHRGLNHPVKNLRTGRCEITSQNHGFNVSEEAIRDSNEVEITHLNLNDGTIEGIALKNRPAFSVQYHPEAAPGPHDARFLFDDFLKMIREN